MLAGTVEGLKKCIEVSTHALCAWHPIVVVSVLNYGVVVVTVQPPHTSGIGNGFRADLLAYLTEQAASVVTLGTHLIIVILP